MAYVVTEILKRVWLILTAPAADPSMLWEVIPLFITMFLMEIYFGKHREEELGWNTAFSNALVLIFVCVNLIRVLYIKNILAFDFNLFIVLSLGALGLLLAFLDFYHWIPKFIAFEISSKLPLNFIAYLVIVYIHRNLVLDWMTLIAVLILFVIIVVCIKLIQMKERPARK